MKIMAGVLVALLLASGAQAQTYAVADTIPADDVWAVTVMPDTVATSDQVILIDWTGDGISSLEGATEGSAAVYLYQLDTGRRVLRVVGPQYLDDWSGARSLVLPGMRVKAVELVDVVGNVILHGRH